jgi:NADH:ubiquinone oxidoreductase subunit H
MLIGAQVRLVFGTGTDRSGLTVAMIMVLEYVKRMTGKR